MRRISHEIRIIEFEDGSHEIDSACYDKTTFLGFASYIMSAGFAEHWIDKLSNDLVSMLHKAGPEITGECCECGDPTCTSDIEEEIRSSQDEPVIKPSEVFTNKDADDADDEDI